MNLLFYFIDYYFLNLQLRLELPDNYIVPEMIAIIELHKRQKAYWAQYAQMRRREKKLSEIKGEYNDIQRGLATLRKEAQRLQQITYIKFLNVSNKNLEISPKLKL